MPEAEQPKTTRRVKNPETFRERAVKAASENVVTVKRRPIRSFVKAIFLPIGRFLKRAFSHQPLKTVGWIAKQIGRVLVPRYFRNSARELRLVTWPNWRLSRRLTYAVLIFAIVFGASVASVDYGLDKVFKAVLLK